MPLVDIHIPQLGEGLVEVRIVRFLKAPGESIARDEPIYTMETDKAEVDIESPIDGVLDSWVVQEDDIVAVGATVARIAVEAPAHVTAPAEPPPPAEHAAKPAPPAPPRPVRNATVPPRTRAYAKKAGLTDEQLAGIPAAGTKLMPADIDRFLVTHREERHGPFDAPEFEEVAMSARQRTLFYRLTSAASQVVPATIEEPIRWEPVEQVYAQLKRQDMPADARPSRFLLVAWCVVKAMARHESFRSTIADVNTLRRYRHANLGIAVALPHDELTTAVVPKADTLGFEDFLETARARIQCARDGADQATQSTAPLSLTGMTAFGVRTGVPVVVPPAVATLFVGAPYESAVRGPDGTPQFVNLVHLVLTFDHRIINGVGAANFLRHVRKRIASLPVEFGLERNA
ncbi:MAG: 2-oxo acid dehydrogenase subunit E2 [Candidatus Hydrogenedentes bacterium]|nr:2-oxo acid dehydrogenase subunit E2 [Candidatus Hydrogenedentota bacterium]